MFAPRAGEQRGVVELVLGRVVPPETGEPPYERGGALNYLARYMAEGSPSLADLAQMAAVAGGARPC